VFFANNFLKGEGIMSDKYHDEVVSPGDKASMLAHDIGEQSFHNSDAVQIVPHRPGDFRGPVGFRWPPHVLKMMMEGQEHTLATFDAGQPHWTMMEEVENDGAGGKPQFFTLVGTARVFRNLGWEIITMVADDFARSGRLPVVYSNMIDVKTITPLNWKLFYNMMQGFGQALEDTALVNITGEIAVMNHSVTAFCDNDCDEQLVLNWGGNCVGLAHHDLLIDNTKIRPGQVIIGFWEPGYRCNGGTFFTNLLLHMFGEKIMDIPLAREFVQKLTVPSKSYARAICDMVGWNLDGSVRPEGERINIAGIAHITGGGLNKLVEILPEGVGAVLDNMMEPAEVLRQAQEMSWGIPELQLSDEQCHTTFHGGHGMLLVVDQAWADHVIAWVQNASKYGIKAQAIGRTVKSATNEVVVHSRFREGKVFSLFPDSE
jgi:phosphoribosylaminoimidazole (AIR) synthetase